MLTTVVHNSGDDVTSVNTSTTGGRADFIFLENEYNSSNARFAYNTRPMQSWLESRAHHILRHLKGEKYNRTVVRAAVCNAAHQLVTIANHQERALAFFNATNQRRQRFAFVDVTTYSGHELAAVLRWLTRPQVEKVDGEGPLVVTPNDLPGAWRIDGLALGATAFKHVGTRIYGTYELENKKMVTQATEGCVFSTTKRYLSTSYQLVFGLITIRLFY